MPNQHEISIVQSAYSQLLQVSIDALRDILRQFLLRDVAPFLLMIQDYDLATALSPRILNTDKPARRTGLATLLAGYPSN